MSSRPLDEPENGRAREASSVGSLQGHHYAAVCWIQPIPGGLLTPSHNVAVQAKSTLFWAATKMRERGGEERRGGRGRGSRRHAGVGKPTRSGLRRTRRLPWLAGQLTRPVKQCVSLWSCGSRDALIDAVTTQRRQSTMGCDGASFSLFIHIHIFFVFFLLPRLRTGRRAAAPPHAPPLNGDAQAQSRPPPSPHLLSPRHHNHHRPPPCEPSLPACLPCQVAAGGCRHRLCLAARDVFRSGGRLVLAVGVRSRHRGCWAARVGYAPRDEPGGGGSIQRAQGDRRERKVGAVPAHPEAVGVRHPALSTRGVAGPCPSRGARLSAGKAAPHPSFPCAGRGGVSPPERAASDAAKGGEHPDLLQTRQTRSTARGKGTKKGRGIHRQEEDTRETRHREHKPAAAAHSRWDSSSRALRTSATSSKK